MDSESRELDVGVVQSWTLYVDSLGLHSSANRALGSSAEVTLSGSQKRILFSSSEWSNERKGLPLHVR